MMLPTSGTSRWRSGALGKGKCQCSGSEGESTIVSSQRSEESNTEGKVGEGFYITLTRFHSQVIFLVSFINSCSNRVVIQEKKNPSWCLLNLFQLFKWQLGNSSNSTKSIVAVVSF